MKTIILILLLVCIQSSTQQFNESLLNTISLLPVLKTSPSDCTTDQYFDIVTFVCRSCPTNSFTSNNDKLNCRCAQTHYFNYNNGGGSVDCKACPVGQVQTLDGFSCIQAPIAPICDESTNSYASDTTELGDSLTTRRCVACNVQSAVSMASSCRSCRPYVFIESDLVNIDLLNCQQKYNTPIGGIYFQTATFNGQPNYFRCPFDSITGSADCADSWYLISYAPAAYRTCRVSSRRNRTSCHQLANMCVLNMYGHAPGTTLDRIDVCHAYDQVYADQSDDMPWLRYAEDYGTYKELYLLNGINSEYLQIKFSSTCVLAPQLNLFAAEYTVDGMLARFGRFDISRLQLCNLVLNLAQNADRSPFSTTFQEQKCSLTLATLFELADNSHKTAIFYDMFLEYGTNGSTLLPIPIKVLNFRSLDTGAQINQNSNENAHQHHRRLFLFDTISSKDNPDSASTHIRYAKSITIAIDLMSGKSAGEIFPPVITVEYATARRDQLQTQPDLQVDVSFSIEYRMNVNSYLLAIYISAGVLCLVAFIWTCIRLWNWNKRAGRYACDQITLFKFLIYICGAIANSLFFVILVGSLYWLIVYRGQAVAFLILPSTSQEMIFTLLIGVAFGLKLIEVIYIILLQTSYDIFFIDWERPHTIQTEAEMMDLSLTSSRPVLPPIKSEPRRVKPGGTGLDMDDLMKDELRIQNRVSCWRTLFVANEWNELQTFRKTNVAIQLIFTLFLLKVINLEELTLKDCSENLFKDINDYRAPYSLVLRVAMASSILTATWIGQWLIYTLIYSRFVEDKIGQFTDFCSISNISVFIMTHSQYGYYIHGRSPHGNADTSMQKMTESLAREQSDLTSKRGLESGSNHQTFSMSFPIRLTRQYFKVMRPLYEARSMRNDRFSSSSNDFEKRMLAYTQLNKFLMSFINNALRDLNYTIVYRNFIENLFGIEFRMPIEKGYFYRDDLNCFTNVLFFGKERTLFIFDLLLFIFVDYFAQNYILAAFVVFIVSSFFRVLRADLGKRNISKKTLVDKRFLI